MSSQAALKFLEKYGMSPENVSPARDAVRMAENIIRIDMLAVQVSDHILSGSVVIDHADKRRTQPHIRDILRDIAADAPVRLDHTSDVTAAGDEFIIRVALDIQQHRIRQCPWCVSPFRSHGCSSALVIVRPV